MKEIGNHRRWLGAVVLTVVLAFVAAAIVSAQGSDGTVNGVIELDGDIANNTDNATHAGADWGPGTVVASVCVASTGVDNNGDGVTNANDGIKTNTTLPPNINIADCLGDSVNPDRTYFASNKDTEDLSDWGCSAINNPTPKDEILNGYAAQGVITSGGNNAGDIALFAGFERGKNNGTSFQGVWFLKNEIGCVAPVNGSADFTGGDHAAWVCTTFFTNCTQTGDLLLLINFTSGGSTPTALLFAWVGGNLGDNDTLVGAAGFNPNGPLQLVVPAGTGGCQGATTNTDICAITNDTTCLNTAWVPGSTDTDPNTVGVNCITGGTGPREPVIDRFQFFEGMLNLTDIFGAPPCFSQVVFEARTSAETSATLKDYILGDFDTCGQIIIRKETDPDGATQTFEFDITQGTLTSPESPCTVSSSSFDLADGESCEFNSVVPGTYVIQEDDPTSFFWDFTNTECTKSGNGTNVVEDEANRKVTITLGQLGIVDCTFFNRQRGTIAIKKVDEAGAPLAGAAFTITPDPKDLAGTLVVADNGANDADNRDGYFCITNAIFRESPASYLVEETTVPPGYAGAEDQNVEVDSTADCETRFADEENLVLVFENKLGTILIKKVSIKGNAVGGACFTITPDPATTPPGSASLVVCDKDATHTGPNTTPDTDNATGSVCVTGVKLNNYSITESTVPTNYKLDKIEPNDGVILTTGVIAVTTFADCAARRATGGSAVVTATNIPLSQIQVKFISPTGETTATINCDGLTPQTPDATPAAFDDVDETYGNLTTTLIPNVVGGVAVPGAPVEYVCRVKIDP